MTVSSIVYSNYISSDQQSIILSTLDSLINDKLNQVDQLRTEILDAVKLSRWEDTPSKLSTGLTSLTELGRTVATEQKILSSLRFENMEIRRSNIVEAHSKHFDWTLIKPASCSQPQTKFIEWLQSLNDIYWISGKAGSGKSTLMKYVCNNIRTKEALELWAGQEELVTASFFFWYAGSSMQKSQQGLLQSLLYEVLSKCPLLIPIVCPRRWQTCKIYGSIQDPWTWDEIRGVFHRLMEQDLLALKYCFFVDGLDEYEGDHLDVIHILKRFAISPNFKICVSSRPWNVFEEAFGKDNHSRLLLQELTGGDIQLYFKNTLKIGLRNAPHARNNPCCDDLVTEIVSLAEGVFLWVYLVIKSLLRGLSNNDDISELQERLRNIPLDLKEFLKRMLDDIGKKILPNTDSSNIPDGSRSTTTTLDSSDLLPREGKGRPRLCAQNPDMTLF